MARGSCRTSPEAARWYRLAADQGHADGQHRLDRADVCEWHGGPQDVTKQAKLLKVACDQGHQPAQDRLGDFAAQYRAPRVHIAGLTAAAHFNGRLGTVVTRADQNCSPCTDQAARDRRKSTSLSWANVRQVGVDGAPR